MLDLARILAAVTAVSEGCAPTDTAKTASEQAVTVVSVVSAENCKDVPRGAPDEQDADAGPEILSRKKSLDRYNRYTSNDAGSRVSVPDAVTDTTDTTGTGCDTYGHPLALLVQCGDCQHYIRNAMNADAGIGTCQLGEPDLGGWPYFPGARRCCVKYVEVEARA